MKKIVKLNEFELHRLIGNTVRKILNEQQNQSKDITSMAVEFAEYLYENGIDVYKFTNMVEKHYEMLKSDNSNYMNTNGLVDLDEVNASEMQKKLINAIRSSRYVSDGFDLAGYYDNCKEMKQVELTKPLWTKYMEDLGYWIWDDNTVEFYVFYGDDDENPDWYSKEINLTDQQIPQIISLIKK